MPRHQSKQSELSPQGRSSTSSVSLQHIIYGLFGLALIYGIIASARGWWVCDDAFISFRYAKNLVNGYGLVYNVGEQVEGYSNFLWTVIMAGGMIVRLDPVVLSVILGIASYVAVGVVFAIVSRKLYCDSGNAGSIYLPITAILLLLHNEMHVFATSGLETMWTAALVSLGFALVLFATDRRAYLWAGMVLALAALSRPDALIFYLVAVPFVALTAPSRMKSLTAFLLPLLLIYVPYWLIRYSYYGWPFPNTYYAKSAGEAYYSQGLAYLWTYLSSYYVLLLTPVAVILYAILRRREIRQLQKASVQTKGILLALFFAVPYMFYIVRMGGDFMFARFWIVITPFLFFFIEGTLRAIRMSRWPLIGLVALLAIATFLEVDVYKGTPHKWISGITKEQTYYPPSVHEQAKANGLKLKKYLGGQDVQIAFTGTFAMHVYYSDLPVAIEAMTGLTDEHIAHQPLTERGRPGHEKNATVEYLDQRGVDFILIGLKPPTTIIDSMNRVNFDGFEVLTHQYDNSLMNHLRGYPEVTFVDIPRWIDANAASLDSMPRQDIEPVYRYFQELYFRCNSDSSREQLFLTAMQKNL